MISRPQMLFWIGLSAFVLASRLVHVNILWADEDYHLAAAIQILHGKIPYRDFWYDKPPLNALLPLLFGAWPGWPLRIASTVLTLAGCAAIFRFASAVWTRREGFLAAALLAFFQVFYFPNAVLTLEPDTFLVIPHVLAIYWAWRGRGLLAGLAAGVGFLLHPKAGLILLSCVFFAPGEFGRMLAGFTIPTLATGAWLTMQGAWGDYLDQVWRWGLQYSASPPEESGGGPLWRLAGWAGFHVVLLLGAANQLRADRYRWRRWVAWCAIALVASALGWRFSPRYLNFLLPPLVLLASAGLARMRSRVMSAAIALLLLIPAVRFGPRYFTLASENLAGSEHAWTDARMDLESRQGAAVVQKFQSPGDTIFVWGYRPNVVAYTRLPVAGKIWDSQPVTGVPADRHLTDPTPLIDAAWMERNRRELLDSSPSIIVDGLSAYNPRLDIKGIPELADWFSKYCPVSSRPEGMKVYRRCAPAR